MKLNADINMAKQEVNKLNRKWLKWNQRWRCNCDCPNVHTVPMSPTLPYSKVIVASSLNGPGKSLEPVSLYDRGRDIYFHWMTAAAIQHCCRLWFRLRRRGQTHQAKAKRHEAEATCHEAKAEAVNFGLEA